MTYICRFAIVPVDDIDTPQSLCPWACFSECLLTSALGCLWISALLSKASLWENAEAQPFIDIVDFTDFQLDFSDLHKISCFQQSLCLLEK